MKKIILISSITFLILLLGAYVAMASSVGPNSPGTMADDSTVGTVAWSNPDNAKVSDAVYATASNGGTGGTTHYLKATNFGFSIPSGATIDGILVEIQRAKTSGGNNVNNAARDSSVKIVKVDGTIGTTNKAATADNWPLIEAYKSYGSSSDLWGETWDDTKINDIDFGVVISASLISDTGTPVAGVDHIRITVYYTEAAPASQTRVANVIIFE